MFQKSEIKNPQKPLTVATVITLVISALYILLYFICPPSELPDKLNEWGDFLAGIASPIIITWLIAGYIMQAQEMANSVAEMKATTEELARQSKIIQQNEIHARRQTHLDLSAVIKQRLVQNALAMAIHNPFYGTPLIRSRFVEEHKNEDLLFHDLSKSLNTHPEFFKERFKQQYDIIEPYMHAFIEYVNLDELQNESDTMMRTLFINSPAKKFADSLVRVKNDV